MHVPNRVEGVNLNHYPELERSVNCGFPRALFSERMFPAIKTSDIPRLPVFFSSELQDTVLFVNRINLDRFRHMSVVDC